MEFRTARMDTYTKVMTIILIALLIVISIGAFNENEGLLWIPVTIMLVAVISSYLMIPKIFLEKGNLNIRNTFVNINIPLISIKSAELYPKVGFNFRTFGVGGLFGYFGYFNGNDVWYVTNIRKKVRIKTLKKTYMISPEEPEKFVAEIKRLQNNINQNET